MPITKILTKFEPEKENLLRVIKEINKQEGWISEKSVNLLAKHFNLKPAEVFSAASFYGEVNTQPVSRITIQICDSANCQLKNAEKIIQAVESFFHQKAGEQSRKVKIERISCLGRCEQGPIMMVNGTIFEKVDPARAVEILRQYV